MSLKPHDALAQESGLMPKLPSRLHELAKRIGDGEAMSIWYQYMGLILSDAESHSALAQLRRLQKAV